MITLENAVALGMVRVEPWGRGHIVFGADDDMIILEQLRDMGAVWRNGGYYVMNDEAAPLMRQLARESKAAASALAARQALAREQGVKLFDNQRARQQKKITREIADVYETALREHEGEIKRLAALLQEGKPEGMDAAEWAAIVARRKNTLAELESVYEGLSEGLANAGAAAERLMSAQLQQSAAISRNVAAWQIDNMTGVNVSRFIGHDLASLALTGITSFHGKYDLAAWQGVADKKKARETIKKAVARGLLTGEHPEKIARRIQGIYSGKEAGSPHKRAVRIARTETARVMSEATVETFRTANERGVKCRQRWDATLDGKTRDSHRKVDGEIREIGEKFSNGLRRVGDGGPADSINCRCCMTPVVDGFKPDAPMRRNNETGELIPYMTYSEWEKTRGVAAVAKPQKAVAAKPKAKTVVKPAEPIHVETVDISLDLFPDVFRVGTAKKRTQKLVDYMNDLSDKAVKAAKAGDAAGAAMAPNPLMMRLYANISKATRVRGRTIPIEAKYGDKGHAVDSWIHPYSNKPTKFQIKNPKMDGDDLAGQVQTTLHEMGHLIDGLFYDEKGEWLSTKRISSMVKANGSAFVRSADDVSDEVRDVFKQAKEAIARVEDSFKARELALKAKYADVIDDGFSGSNPERYREYRNKLYEIYQEKTDNRDYLVRNEFRGLDNFTDIYDALSGGLFRDNGIVDYGHGSRYYKRVASRAHEIFANYCALSVTRPDLIEVLRRDKPELVKMLDDMLEEMLREMGVL